MTQKIFDNSSKRDIMEEVFSIMLTFSNEKESCALIFEKDNHYHNYGGWEAWVDLFDMFADEIKK